MTKSVVQVRPITTERDHASAVKRVAELVNAAPGSIEGDELNILATLVDAYELKHFPIGCASSDENADSPDPSRQIHLGA